MAARIFGSPDDLADGGRPAMMHLAIVRRSAAVFVAAVVLGAATAFAQAPDLKLKDIRPGCIVQIEVTGATNLDTLTHAMTVQVNGETLNFTPTVQGTVVTLTLPAM